MSVTITKTKRLRGDASSRFRSRLFARDGHRCVYCGTLDGPFQWEHVRPVALGGQNTMENAVTICEPCHGAVTQVANRRTHRAKILAGIRPPRATHATRMWTLDRFPWLLALVVRYAECHKALGWKPATVFDREKGDAGARWFYSHMALCRAHGIRTDHRGKPIEADMDRFNSIEPEPFGGAT